MTLARQRAAIARLQDEINNASAGDHMQDSSRDHVPAVKETSASQHAQTGSLQSSNAQPLHDHEISVQANAAREQRQHSVEVFEQPMETARHPKGQPEGNQQQSLWL